jgi:hypothetical protein
MMAALFIYWISPILAVLIFSKNISYQAYSLSIFILLMASVVQFILSSFFFIMALIIGPIFMPMQKLMIIAENNTIKPEKKLTPIYTKSIVIQ